MNGSDYYYVCNKYNGIINSLEEKISNLQSEIENLVVENIRINNQLENANDCSYMKKELEYIATYILGVTYPVPEHDAPIHIQVRSLVGEYEDEIAKLKKQLKRMEQ